MADNDVFSDGPQSPMAPLKLGAFPRFNSERFQELPMSPYKEETKNHDWTEQKPEINGFNLGDVPQFYLTPGCKKQSIREEATPESLASNMRAFSLG